MPYTAIAPGATGSPDFVSRALFGYGSIEFFFEVLQNDVFISSTYPPTAGVGQNGWDASATSLSASVSVPLDVNYQAADIFELRAYQSEVSGNTSQSRRYIYRFQVAGSGNGGGTEPPNCITVSQTVGIVALQGAQMMRVTPPPLGSLCYQVTKNNIVYSVWFDGTWHLTSPGPTPEPPPGGGGSGTE